MNLGNSIVIKMVSGDISQIFQTQLKCYQDCRIFIGVLVVFF